VNTIFVALFSARDDFSLVMDPAKAVTSLFKDTSPELQKLAKRGHAERRERKRQEFKKANGLQTPPSK